MTASTTIQSHRRRRAFTLTELLIVIAIIALLVSLLLAAMTQVQAKARETRTLATMQAFSNACDAFQQEHGFYPGIVPEAILAVDGNQEKLTGTENAILHLMGGFVRQEDVADGEWGNYTPDQGWILYRFTRPDGGNTYQVKINVGRIGEGPILGGKPYAPYLTPGDDEFGVVDGQVGEDEPGARPQLPDLLDAWGQPIIYLRRTRSVGSLTEGDKPQFNGLPMSAYCDSASLGGLGRNQLYSTGERASGSILSSGVDSDERLLNLRKLLEHPALPGQARGAYLLLSAGRDGIYLSATDGAGAPGTPVTDVGNRIEGGPDPLPPTIFDEYDDVIMYGGGG